MDRELKAWFVREVLVHERALTRFLRRSSLGPGDAADLCHDVYIRVLEAAERQRPTSAKAFLFTTARNLMVDRARRNQVIPIDLLQDVESLNVSGDDITPERAVSGLQHLLRLTEAFEGLPDRCREVVWMRKIEDIPQKVIAERLGIAETTVEGHLVRGIRLLAQLCFSEERNEARAARGKAAARGHKRGK
jgi:RNA polymerase sigma factor (sigma-70 family)